MKRVHLFILAIIFMFSFVLTGCSAKAPVTPTVTDQPAATAVEATKTPEATKAPEAASAVVEYKESPFLTGKGLPPVKDRLPKEPKLTNEMPPDMLTYEIGTYGGTIRTLTIGIEADGDARDLLHEELLTSPGALGKELTGNILKGYEMSADQKEFTFHMREGLKWSDGTPVTSEDIRFTVEDVIYNKELTTILPAWLCSGGDATGTPAKFTAVDDFTFKFAFDKPYGGFAMAMGTQAWRGYTELLKPATFLKKFHKKYNTDTVALEAAIKAAKFKPGEWVNLFWDRDINKWETASFKSIGFPVLYPWVYTKKNETVAEFERNPYYFKVDTAGNQLPYIDKIVSTYVTDIEVLTMKTIAGEADVLRDVVTLAKMPLYKENEAKGGYKVYLNPMHETPSDVFLNLTYKDENWRKVVQDERFRKALNLGIDRQDIIDTVYFGLAEPTIIQDPTFDVAAANKLLDEMGMTKGADGFRKGPDGKKFTIPFEVAAHRPDLVPVTQLFMEQWKALGLDVTMKTIDASLWGSRLNANELKASVIWTTNTATWYMGDWGQNYWGPLWNRYIASAGTQGEKPPADVQKLYDLIKKLSVNRPEDATPTIEEVKAELKVHNWYFSYLSNAKQPLIVNAKIGNVSDKGSGIAAVFSGEQFFFKK